MSEDTIDKEMADAVLNLKLNVFGAAAFLFGLIFNIFDDFDPFLGTNLFRGIFALIFLSAVFILINANRFCPGLQKKFINRAHDRKLNSLLSTYTGFGAVLFCMSSVSEIDLLEMLFLIASFIVFVCYLIKANNDSVENA